MAGLSAIATAHSLGCKVHVLISMGGCGKHHVKKNINITFSSLDVYALYVIIFSLEESSLSFSF